MLLAQGAAELGLHAALQRAVAQHPLVEAARARVAAARGARLTARTLPNPVLTYWTENLGGPPGTVTGAFEESVEGHARHLRVCLRRVASGAPGCSGRRWRQSGAHPGREDAA